MKLTLLQERFCQEYLVDGNGKQAAIRAGFSPRSAKNQASSLLRKPHICARLEALQTARSERIQLDADYVLKRLLEIDQMDAQDILEDDGNLKPVAQWPLLWRQLISNIEVSEMARRDGTVVTVKKIRWPDKIKNLEMLGRHSSICAFKEKIEISTQNELAERIKASRERLLKQS